ncbi:MAG: hypothetical protein WD768_12900 [Phycisphaeraceae bacterium]
MPLDAGKLIGTILRLQSRIGERFPEAHLLEVAGDVVAVAQQTAQRVAHVRRSQPALRAIAWLLALGMAAVLAFFILNGTYRFEDTSGWEMMQGVEAFISSFVFLGAAIVFIITLERRVKRRRALSAIHELRVLAHLIDMHQLDKDPDRLFRKHGPADTVGGDTASSPKTDLTAFELNRYLDYCAEMLSLIGKISVLYSQDMDDEVVLAAVDDVETLTTGLSRKIWQKIMLLNSLVQQAEK